MADIKLSALPLSGTIGAFDKIPCLVAGVAKLATPNDLFQTPFQANTVPTLTDTVVVASATDSAADLLTLQQLKNTDSLLANDAAPSDTDKIRVNQGGVAKTLAVSALRTQLDAFASARTIAASQISLSTGSALQLPLIVQFGGTTGSFPAVKRSGGELQFRAADDSGDAWIAAAFVRAPTGAAPKAALNRGVGTKSLGLQLASDMGLGWGSGVTSETSPDLEMDRIAAGVLGLTNASTGGAALQLKQMTAPAGATAAARLFTQDNGAGKTQLMVIFPTGTAIQLAIEA